MAKWLTKKRCEGARKQKWTTIKTLEPRLRELHENLAAELDRPNPMYEWMASHAHESTPINQNLKLVNIGITHIDSDFRSSYVGRG